MEQPKQRNQRAPSDSNSSGQLVQGATPRPEFQNRKFTNHQCMTKIFQFLQKRLGITAGCSIFSTEALKNKCVDMVVCSCPRWQTWMFTRARTSRRLKVYSLSLRIRYWEHSECETAREFIFLMDEISIVS